MEPRKKQGTIHRKTKRSQKKEEEKEKKSKPEAAQAAPVKLVYHITEGPQTRVRRVLLSGYHRTRVGVIQREVRVKPGAPLREGDVVESQRRLYNLGVFNRVTIDPQNPDGSDPNKDIVVLVEEAKRYTMAYGGGFEVQRLASTTNPTGGEIQAAPRGIFELTKVNLTGRADSLSLKAARKHYRRSGFVGLYHPQHVWKFPLQHASNRVHGKNPGHQHIYGNAVRSIGDN